MAHNYYYKIYKTHENYEIIPHCCYDNNFDILRKELPNDKAPVFADERFLIKEIMQAKLAEHLHRQPFLTITILAYHFLIGEINS